MKKIIAMLMMMVLATFASPLFATNTSPPSFEKIFKINNGKKYVNVKKCDAGAGATVKININHRDTLLFVLKKVDSNKEMEISGSITIQTSNLVAVVCQRRGVTIGC